MIETALARAQAGDGEAFRELIEPYRGELQTHCYRILGSVADAEDVLQETLLAAWRSLGQFDGRSLRSWLYRIATNRCLNYLRGESRRRRPAGPPDPGAGRTLPVRSDEPWWLEPYPDVLLGDVAPGPEARYDARESIALSFVAGLQHLPPQQRAVLVLRDVLGFPAAEAAGILGTTPAAVNSALIRARAGLRPGRDPHDVPLPRSAAEAAVVERFVDAFERYDLDRLVALLTGDARLTMPPEPIEFRGPQAITGYLQSHLPPFWGQEVKFLPTRANNQPALVLYLPDPCAPIWRASSLVVLTLRGEQVCGITRFGALGLVARFGLPRTLPRD
jgi:RNA polymerase sigma-70 factor (TIGR02960 family)